MASVELATSAGEQVRRFWRWWSGELRECVPSALVRWSTRLSVLPLVVPEGSNGYSIHRFDGEAWRRVGQATGDTPEALAKALGGRLQNLGIDRFTLGLSSGQFLAKTVHLPAAAEENLRNALRYELDRHTPFKPEDVGFDCVVLGRDAATREIAVRLVIAPKATIAQAVERVAASGALVAGVQPAFVERSSLSINVLPHEENGSAPLQRLLRWAPWALLAALGAAALVLPVYQKRAQVIELQPQVMIAAQQAQAADGLHQQLDRAQNEYNFLLQKRYASPTTLQLLNEVTRILPDDTWLQNFELRTTAKAKELQLQGETGVAGKLIELFEQSPLLTGASFKSPVTQAPGSQGSRFHLGMEVKEGAPPAPSIATAAPQPAPGSNPVAATGLLAGPGSGQPAATGAPTAAATAPATTTASAANVPPATTGPARGGPTTTPTATAPSATSSRGASSAPTSLQATSAPSAADVSNPAAATSMSTKPGGAAAPAQSRTPPPPPGALK
jgi:general secretion pathway protein L